MRARPRSPKIRDLANEQLRTTARSVRASPSGGGAAVVRMPGICGMVGHMVDQAPDVAPHPIRDSDVRLLIGMLAVLEGFALAGELPPRIADKLIDRFIRLSLLEPGATPKDLRQALNDLNHRL